MHDIVLIRSFRLRSYLRTILIERREEKELFDKVL